MNNPRLWVQPGETRSHTTIISSEGAEYDYLAPSGLKPVVIVGSGSIESKHSFYRSKLANRIEAELSSRAGAHTYQHRTFRKQGAKKIKQNHTKKAESSDPAFFL